MRLTSGVTLFILQFADSRAVHRGRKQVVILHANKGTTYIYMQVLNMAQIKDPSVGVRHSPGRRGHNSSNGRRRSLVRNGGGHNNDTKIKATASLLCIPS